MANIYVYSDAGYAFDAKNLDFYQMFDTAFDTIFRKGGGFNVEDATYSAVFRMPWGYWETESTVGDREYRDTGYTQTNFHGNDLTGTQAGMTGGTVEALVEQQVWTHTVRTDTALLSGSGEARLWTATGLSIPVGDIDAVAATPGTRDDRALFRESLTGNDLFDLSGGDDIASGHAGEDRILGRAGNDTLSGNRHDDLLRGGDGDDLVLGGYGRDALFGNRGADTLLGHGHADVMHGGRGNDALHGGLGGDRLFGDRGNDVLYGNRGDDALFGNTGNDTLFGGVGNDSLSGGAGVDSFVLKQGTGVDAIEDYEIGVDRLVLAYNLHDVPLRFVERDADTMIEIAASGEDLVLVLGVEPAQIIDDLVVF